MSGDLPRRPEVAPREPQTPLAEDGQGKSQRVTQALSELMCARQRRLHLGRRLAVHGEHRHREAQLQLEFLACPILGIRKRTQGGDRAREMVRRVAICVALERVLRRVLAVLERAPRITARLEADGEPLCSLSASDAPAPYASPARADAPVQLAPVCRAGSARTRRPGAGCARTGAGQPWCHRATGHPARDQEVLPPRQRAQRTRRHRAAV
jgi:hypothetical protein